MGYNLYLTRAEEWSENEGREIHADEWLALVKTDPELTIDRPNGPYFAEWMHQAGRAEAWFDLDDGNVYTKHLEDAAIIKMLQMADLLRARVQGEEGETYRLSGGKVVCDRTDSGNARSMPAWQQRLLIIAVGLLVGTVLLAVCLLLS